MQRFWREMLDHRRSTGLFLLYWVIAYGLHVLRWNAPRATGDVVRPVLELHFLLPVIAGALVAWWRSASGGRIGGGALAGAVVMAVDTLLIFIHGAFASGDFQGGEGMMEVPAFLIAIGLAGAVLGSIGAGGAAAVMRVAGRSQGPAAMPAVPPAPPPRRLVMASAALLLSAAAIVAVGVIPPVGSDTFVGAAPARAVPAFLVNLVLNVGLAALMFVPLTRRGGKAGKVALSVAGWLALLLGFALLGAASAFRAHGPGMARAVLWCIAGGVSDLAAGVLALVAALRRRESGAAQRYTGTR